MMAQAYIDNTLQNKKRTAYAIYTILEEIDNIPIITESYKDVTEIKGALFDYSNKLISSIIMGKSLQLLKHSSKYIETKDILQLSNEFLSNLKTTIQTFEKNLHLFIEETDTMNMNNQREPMPYSSDTGKQTNTTPNQKQTTFSNNEQASSSDNENSNFGLRNLKMTIKRNETQQICTQQPVPTHTNFHKNQGAIIVNDLHSSTGSNDDETNICLQQQNANNDEQLTDPNSKDQESQQDEDANENNTKSTQEEIHSTSKKPKLSKNEINQTAAKSKPFQCCVPHCYDRSYSSWNNLAKHIRKHKLEKCPINECSDKIFEDWTALSKHLKYNHVIKNQEK